MSLTNLLIPSFKQMLQALASWLDKAEQQLPAAEAEALLAQRLAPGMFPLATQIRFVCLQAQEPAFRLKGEPLPETLVQLTKEGAKAAKQPGSISDAKTRITEALTFLETLKPDALDAGSNHPVTLDLPNGMTFDMTGDQYARDWSLPQFYFHLNTAYAILRNQNIDLGKADYVPHMFAYIRPGSMPKG